MDHSDSIKDITPHKKDADAPSPDYPIRPDPRLGKDYDLPYHYDDNKVVLMVRDPWTIYAYWEIRKDIEGAVKKEMQKRRLVVSKSLLRVYDVTENDPDRNPKIVFDFELKNWADNWYINDLHPGRQWMVDIGILSTKGDFFRLARSNMVKTPVHGVSDLYSGNNSTSRVFGSINLFKDRK
jgi:hypothetical protein